MVKYQSSPPKTSADQALPPSFPSRGSESSIIRAIDRPSHRSSEPSIIRAIDHPSHHLARMLWRGGFGAKARFTTQCLTSVFDQCLTSVFDQCLTSVFDQFLTSVFDRLRREGALDDAWRRRALVRLKLCGDVLLRHAVVR